MPVEPPPPIVAAYLLFVLLIGIGCLIHFFFLSKGSVKIDPENSLAGWKLSFADFFFGLFSLILIVMMVLTVLDAFVPKSDGQAIQIVFFGFAMHLVALSVLYTFYRMIPGKFQDPFNRTSTSWAQAFKVALYSFFAVTPIIYALAYAWQLLLKALNLEVPPQETVEFFSQIEQLPILVLMIILTVLVAPFSEEILFRGCLYRFLKAKVSVAFALIASGLLFALLHQNLLTFMPLLVLGIALAYTYEKTGSIKVPILFHSIFNLNTVLIIVLTMNPGS